MIGNLRYDEQMEIAEQLYEAERTATPIGKITDRYPEMNIHDAYKIQEMGVKLRITGRGSIIGRKLGATNEHMMQSLQAESPDCPWPRRPRHCRPRRRSSPSPCR